MDYDEAFNLSNHSSSRDIPPSEPSYIAHEIIFTIFAAAAITCNFLIIYTVLRFKRLRVAPFMYLVTWSMTDLFSLILLPSGLRLISILDHHRIPTEVYCVAYQSGSICHGGTILSVTLVAIDWVVAAYFHRASERFRRWYKSVIVIFWVVVLANIFYADYLCWEGFLHFLFPLMFVILTLCILCLVVIVIHIIRLVQKLRKRPSDYSSLGINLATVFLNCWTLNILNLLFTYMGEFYAAMAVLSLCLVYSSSIFNFCLLYRFNNDFSACVRQVLSCKRIEYKEDLTESATIQTNVNSDSVSIDFRNSKKIEGLHSSGRK